MIHFDDLKILASLLKRQFAQQHNLLANLFKICRPDFNFTLHKPSGTY